MTSNVFFTVPESLRPKKASNSPPKSVGSSRSHPYSPSRRYKDLDDPLGPSSSSSRPQPLFKRTLRTGVASGRHSIARAARVARRRLSSSQQGSSSSQDLPPASMKSSPFGVASTGKRLKASRRGTVRSGVDNRFRRVTREVEPVKPRAREPVISEESATKSERHVDATKVESVTEKIVLSKSAVVRQLKRMIGRICESDYDKYQVLEERDKLMHRGRLKATDVENATTMQGTCTDMCPEKERYLRVVQKRLSSYESREDGGMAPELTVKEYSRSAADQEEPLPHELRPADVLHLTMNYLIGKIANHIPETDEELAQWYDFLWNRTRAIRKDITQQMMVNDTAVSLIEQCVRLHIFASHRLCELNFNEFDQKMNTENLSKSLQSLRYLYEDLAKKGIFYSSEAEFRAYEIMLNLSDSNVFQQALTLRREILEAGPVRLAIRLFTCLQNKNYVRFFRLLTNDATYLQCCLCHRYFTRVRHQAVYAMSHSVHITGKYPLKKFIQLLGFDDRDAALQFLDCYSVRRINDLDTGEELMLMSKTRLMEPIEEPPLKIHSWIEGKSNGFSITEVLSGGMHIEAEVRSPLNSFDRHGAYVSDPVLNDYINEYANEQLAANEDEAVTFTFTPSGPRKEEDVVGVLAEKSADGLINEEVTRICCLTYGKSVAHSLTTELYDGILEDCLKPCCQEVMMAVKLMHRHKLAADAAKHQQDEIRLLCGTLHDSVLNEVIDGIVRNSSQKWMRKYQQMRNEELLVDIVKGLLNDLISQTVTETVREIGESKIEEGINYVKYRLKEINERLDKLWLKQFVDRWREQIKYRKEEQRKKIELLGAFPVILPAKSGLVFRRRDGIQFGRDIVDCSKLLFEQKLNAFIEKRHEKIARKVLAKWRSWTQFQIEKREFFTTTNMACPLKRRRRHSNNNISKKNEDDIRLAVALAEVECEQLKSFWTTWQIEDELKEEQNLSWCESLAQQSSVLLDHVDAETLEKGVRMARQNLERVHGTQRAVKLGSSLGRSEGLGNISYSLNQQLLSKNHTKNSENIEEAEEGCPPAKKERKNLERLTEQLEKFTKKLDDACEEMDERNRRYDEILRSLNVGN